MLQIKNKMDCNFVRDHLFSYQENQLSGEEKIMFEKHLGLCPECHQIVAEFNALALLIDKKKSMEPNPYIKTRTLQRIESELEREQHRPVPYFGRRLQPVFIPLLVLFAMAIGFTVGMGIDLTFSGVNRHDQKIEALKSDLSIPDFIDEDNSFFANR